MIAGPHRLFDGGSLSPWFLAQQGDLVVVSAASPDRTVLIDGSGAALRTTVRDGFFAACGCTTASGRTIAVGRLRHKNPYRIYDVDPTWSREPSPVPFEVPWPDLNEVYAAGERVVVTPPTYLAERGQATPVLLDGAPLPLPAVQSTDQEVGRGSCTAHAVGPDRFVLLWSSRGFLVGSGEVTPLDLEPVIPEDFACRYGSRDFVEGGRTITLVNRSVVAFDESGGAQRVAPDIENVMACVPLGDTGAAVLMQGNNVEGDRFKVRWPNGDVACLKEKDIGLAGHVSCMAWLPSRRALLILVGGAAWLVPWDFIEGLKRLSAADFAKKHASKVRSAWSRKVKAAQKKGRSVEAFGPQARLEYGGPLVDHPQHGLGVVISSLSATGTREGRATVEFADDWRTFRQVVGQMWVEVKGPLGHL